MPRGSRRTTYVRDTRGRFASTPGGGAPKRPPAKKASRGTNRLTRDNSGRITSVGGNGATARGGRLRTGAGNLRGRQTMAVLSNGRMASVPKGTIGRTRKQREITMIDRPLSQRQAYNEGRAKQMAAIAARKAPKASAPGRIKAGRQKSTVRNTTGQSKTLNKFNSRPVGTMVAGRGDKLVPSPTRVPLRVAGPGAKYSDQAFARVATKAARSRAASAGRKVAAAKKPAGWMQSPEARKDRVQQAADRKGYAKKLRALPKDARRAIQVERLARRQKGIVVAGSTASQLTNIAQGRIRLIGNVGKRKGKLTPGQIGAMARTMSESARRLKVGMATARRGRMKYNPNALQIATGTAAKKIRGARAGGVARKTGAAKPKKKAIASKSPATSKIRPGELMNANAFPSNAIAKSIMRIGGAAMFGNNRRTNLATAARYARRRGYAAQFISKGAKAEVANYTAGGSVGRRKGTIGINVDSPAWDNPNQYMRSANKGGRSYATTTGKGIMAHEMGHRIHTYGDLNQWNDYNNPKVQAKLQIARKVSTYAAIGGPEEFIAEYRAGRATGRRYTRDIVALYREVVNKPNPSARRRSRLRRTPKP